MLWIFLTIEDEEQRNLAEKLYLTYKSKMYGIAFSILHNRYDAEDAVMDALVNIVKNIYIFCDTPRNKTEALIVIIVRNAAINRYNANKRRSPISIDELSFCLEDKELSPEQSLVNAENYEGLLKSIRSLEPIYRDVMLLKYLYEYGNAKISEILGVSESTVRVRLMRARKTLEKLIKGGKS